MVVVCARPVGQALEHLLMVLNGALYKENKQKQIDYQSNIPGSGQLVFAACRLHSYNLFLH